MADTDLLEAASKLYELRNIILAKIGAAGHRCVRSPEGEWTTEWICDPYTQAFKDLGTAIAKAKGE